MWNCAVPSARGVQSVCRVQSAGGVPSGHGVLPRSGVMVGALVVCGLLVGDLAINRLLGPNLLSGVAWADDRSTEVFRYTCSNHLGRRDVTLFANGTVRLRQGLWDDQELQLDELLPEELQTTLGTLRRLHASGDPLAAGSLHSGPQGDWVDACELVLALPGEPTEQWEFTPLEIPALIVSQLIQVAEDLADFTRPLAVADRVPTDYRPSRGDVLVTTEGKRYRVVALTIDGRGVELEGIDTPLRIFVSLDELSNAFASVGEQGRR